MFKVVKTRLGVSSIQNLENNEVMHNPLGPWTEANNLYIAQSGLSRKLTAQPANGDEPLIIFDVGLGAAANSIAAIDHRASLGNLAKPLKIVSFENELRLAHFALENHAEFPHISKWKEALSILLETGRYSKGPIEWVLRHGDFLEGLQQDNGIPDVIFFDPYSPKTNPKMWEVATFTNIREKCLPSKKPTVLLTYSRATPIRTALLLAGFYIGAGQSDGEVDLESTHAATHLEALENPLGARWLERWERSNSRYPNEMDSSFFGEMWKKIHDHPQFMALAKSQFSGQN
jgi:tRNA U34 5-methylaminomethyl-2-thiouridine-forming methyltransferase MnmC